MRIVELHTPEEFNAVYPLVRQLNPGMTRPVFRERLEAMRTQGYRCVAAVEHGKILGIAGFWTGTRFWCGPYIDIDNIVVDKGLRSNGVGSKLVAWIEEEGQRLGCDTAVLDSYTVNHSSHRFYFREGYMILGYHFVKTLDTKMKPRAGRQDGCGVAVRRTSA